MRLARVCLIAFAVLTAGVGLAQFFRRNSGSPDTTLPRNDDQVVRRRESASQAPTAALPFAPLRPRESKAPGVSSGWQPLSPRESASPFEIHDPAPPAIAQIYPHDQKLPDRPPPPIARPATPTVHQVVDGDTLPALAGRYLGDANRAAAIFDANRDVLRDPELLPIGAVLKIPPKQ